MPWEMSYNPYYSEIGSDSNVGMAAAGKGKNISATGKQYGMQQPSLGPQTPQQQQQQNGSYLPSASTNMAFQFGQTAFNQFVGQENISQFQETMSKATGATNSSVAHYFQVSNSYVFHKFKLITVPFLQKNWQRIPDSSNSFQPPRIDVNSPDLYIPVMGLVTYILAWNVTQGLNGSFDPENLYFKLSSTLAFFLLDLIILRLGLYLLVSNTTSPVTSLVELTCYVGYKFVPLIFSMFFPASFIWLNRLAKLYLFVAFGVFLLRSIKFNLFADMGNSADFSFKKGTVKKVNYFLFVYGFFWQSVLMWLMG